MILYFPDLTDGEMRPIPPGSKWMGEEMRSSRESASKDVTWLDQPLTGSNLWQRRMNGSQPASPAAWAGYWIPKPVEPSSHI